MKTLYFLVLSLLLAGPASSGPVNAPGKSGAGASPWRARIPTEAQARKLQGDLKLLEANLSDIDLPSLDPTLLEHRLLLAPLHYSWTRVGVENQSAGDWAMSFSAAITIFQRSLLDSIAVIDDQASDAGALADASATARDLESMSQVYDPSSRKLLQAALERAKARQERTGAQLLAGAEKTAESIGGDNKKTETEAPNPNSGYAAYIRTRLRDSRVDDKVVAEFMDTSRFEEAQLAIAEHLDRSWTDQLDKKGRLAKIKLSGRLAENTPYASVRQKMMKSLMDNTYKARAMIAEAAHDVVEAVAVNSSDPKDKDLAVSLFLRALERAQLGFAHATADRINKRIFAIAGNSTNLHKMSIPAEPKNQEDITRLFWTTATGVLTAAISLGLLLGNAGGFFLVIGLALAAAGIAAIREGQKTTPGS